MADYTRLEQYLDAISGGGGPVPDPVSREDYFLAKIAGADVQLPDPPYTRKETYLAYLAGADVIVPQPVAHLEFFLYAACGGVISLPVPVTREEELWALYPGGGTTIENVSVAAFNDGADEVPFEKLIVNIDPYLSGRTSVALYHMNDLFTAYGTEWEDGSIDSSGGDTSSTYYERTKDLIPVDGITTLRLRFYQTSNNGRSRVVYAYDEDGEPKSELLRGSGSGSGMKSITAATDGYARVKVALPVFRYAAMCDDSTDKTQTISLGSNPVYGGVLDVMEKKVTVTHAYIASYDGSLDDYLKAHKWISSDDTYAEGTAPSVGASVVYELEETYWTVIENLTIEEPKTYEGANMIWASSGNITLTYIPGAPMADSAKADKAILTE